MLRRGQWLKTTVISVVGKVSEKVLNNRPVDHLAKCGLFFPISTIVADLLEYLQIF